jgi:hypothetical protein
MSEEDFASVWANLAFRARILFSDLSAKLLSSAATS